MKYKQTLPKGAGGVGLPPRGDTAAAAVRRIPCVNSSVHSPGRIGLFPVIRYSRGCRIIPPQPVPRERRKTDQIFDLSIAYHSPSGESSPNLEFSMNIM